MAIKPLSSPDRIAFSDLVEKVFDAEFDATFPENGKFEKERRRDRDYWYYRGYEKPPTGGKGHQLKKYVGPADDPEITKRVERFERVRSSYRQRRELATRLRQAGLPAPSPIEGAVTDILAKAGLFDLRAVLVGSIAYQAYGGLLGIRLDEAHYRTDDIDIAQFYGIAHQLDDKLSDVESLLKQADPSFEPIFNPSSPNLPIGYRNGVGFKVEFLTPNRGNAVFEQSLVQLPALGGVGAQPLRYLDFLIRKPVRSILLHHAGVGVLVPAPERYAIHKLILATRRSATVGASKSTKDVSQADELIHAMDLAKQTTDLGFAWMEAWQRGPSWRRRLAVGTLRLSDEAFKILSDAVVNAAHLDDADPAAFGMNAGRDGLIEKVARRRARGASHSL